MRSTPGSTVAGCSGSRWPAPPPKRIEPVKPPLPGPDLARLPERLQEAGLAAGAPVFLRVFKSERGGTP